jgi:phosphoenolpyruvate synthase/pyruvate phosphate dikinase
VNVQTMVFGNKGDDSGTGVAFTRDPATGEKKSYGDFLANAQGEDVVAGTRTPQPLTELHMDFRSVGIRRVHGSHHQRLLARQLLTAIVKKPVHPFDFVCVFIRALYLRKFV